MKIALVLRYLFFSVFESLLLFLEHWYLDTWFWISDFVKKRFTDSSPIAPYVSGVFALFYLIWALLPVYLLISMVFGYADFI